MNAAGIAKNVAVHFSLSIPYEAAKTSWLVIQTLTATTRGCTVENNHYGQFG